ncbi:hypothetical protein HGB07_01345, partial [Candidatus Roizmanbacteria bacterium]|nr:hypothetical protein [Candidatus Roizmanbacteria bacterium]
MPQQPPPPGDKFKSGNTPTTQIGYVNKNKQEVLGTRGKSGNLPGQKSYKVRCLSENSEGKVCRNIYGANGCDLHIRKCTKCQGG